MIDLKRCTVCGEWKPLREFSPIRNRPSRRSRCKACQRKSIRQWVSDNPEKHRTAQRRARLQANYSLSLDGYAQLVKVQGDRCGICGTTERPRSKGGQSDNWCIEHNHETGAVRGLVCHGCNTDVAAVEKLINDPDRLQKLLAWIGSDADYRSVLRLFE